VSARSGGSTGDAREAAAFAPFRPHRGRRVAWAFVVLSLVGSTALALVMPATGYAGWSVGDSLLVVAFGVLVALVMWRFAVIRAVPSRQGLVVHNVAVTRDLAWGDIERVRFSGGDAWAWLELVDGDELAVMAIQRSDGPFGRREASRLVALVETAGGARRRDGTGPA
jgi:hypothetical protein